jgi:hypothetical protein
MVALWARGLAPRVVRAREGLAQCSISSSDTAWRHSSTVDLASVRAVGCRAIVAAKVAIMQLRLVPARGVQQERGLATERAVISARHTTLGFILKSYS